MVFNRILSTIIVGLRTFPFSISIMLTSLSYSALAIIDIFTIYFIYLLNYLV